MRCQLRVAEQSYFAYTRQNLEPNTKAVMTSADRINGTVGGIYSANLEVKRAITNETANHVVNGSRGVWGMVSPGGIEVTFTWSDLQFLEAGSFYFEIAVTEHMPDAYNTPFAIRASVVSNEIIVSDMAPTHRWAV